MARNKSVLRNSSRAGRLRLRKSQRRTRQPSSHDCRSSRGTIGNQGSCFLHSWTGSLFFLTFLKQIFKDDRRIRVWRRRLRFVR